MTDLYFECEMVDMDRWNAYKKKHGADEVKLSIQLMEEHDVVFTAHNANQHLTIYDSGANARIDFWPSTGVWTTRSKKIRGRGAFNMLRFMKKITT